MFMHNREIVRVLNELGLLAADEKFWAETIREAEIKNPWYTEYMILQALKSWSRLLSEEEIQSFADRYPIADGVSEVGIVMAGNIPLVGLHDLICVLLSGNKAKVKTSREDNVLTKRILEWLDEQLPGRIEVCEQLKNIDAVIATGSNNTSRYFEYYFRNIPHLIRKNRTSIAILDENDDEEAFRKLSLDVFLYFGLGCRNVGKLYIPQNFDLIKLLDAWQDWAFLSDHNKYGNNVLYHRAIYLMNQISHLDTGFVLLKEDASLFSPLGCVYYTRYQDIHEVLEIVEREKEHIQCITSRDSGMFESVPFGEAQFPKLDDFADRINTMEFLQTIQINRKDLA